MTVFLLILAYVFRRLHIGEWKRLEFAKLSLLVTAVLCLESAQESNEHRKKSANEICIILDHSYSMSARDTPTQQSRFESAKKYADAFLNELYKNHSGIYVSLFSFGEELVEHCAPTADLLSLRAFLSQLTVRSYEDTSFHVLKKLSQRVLIIFSDGENHDFLNFSSRDAVFCVGVGRKEGALLEELGEKTALHEAFLKKISHGGAYFYAEDFHPQLLAQRLAGRLFPELSQKSAPHSFLILMAALCMLIFLRLRTYCVTLFIIFLCVDISAGEKENALLDAPQEDIVGCYNRALEYLLEKNEEKAGPLFALLETAPLERISSVARIYKSEGSAKTVLQAHILLKRVCPIELVKQEDKEFQDAIEKREWKRAYYMLEDAPMPHNAPIGVSVQAPESGSTQGKKGW